MTLTGPRATSDPVDNAPADVAPVMDGIAEDHPLFGGYEPPASEPEQLSAGQRLTRRQAEQVAAGIHPLTGGRLHPDADRSRTKTSPQDGTPTCGTCMARVALDYHGKRYPKCLEQPANVTHGPATDVRAWWPACAKYESEAGA